MEAILTEYRGLIIGIFVALGLFVFRRELNKLIDWIVGFKRLSKTKDGYSASAAPEASGAAQPDDTTDKDQSVIKEAKETETNQQQAEPNWVKPFLEKDYDGACEVLRGIITDEHDPKKRHGHQAVLGRVLFEKDRLKGIAYFEELLKTRDTAATVYNWYALSLFWDNDYAEAQSVLAAGIKACPDDSKLPNLQGLVFHRQGNHAEAADILMRTINRYPKEPSSYRTLAQLLADIGMTEQAISFCQVGMARCPQDADLVEKYVKILPEDEHNKERMLGYLRLTKMRKDNASYMTLLGNEYLQLGFHDMAFEAYRKGNALAEEKEAWVLANIGNILKNQGFYSYGAEYIQRAVAIDPKSQYAHERLGKALKLAEDQKQKRDEIRAEVMKTIEADHPLDGIVDQVRNGRPGVGPR